MRYVVALGKRDTSFLEHFTWDTLLDFEGLARVLTVLARGYLFHLLDGSLADDPRSHIEYARRALCAWCSVPDPLGAAPKKDWQFQTEFRGLHDEFRFDTALADGLEQGPLQMTDVTVPEEPDECIRAVLPKSLPLEMVCTLSVYYAANKPEDSDWVILPVASFDAYFGTISFGRKYLRLIPEEILKRPDSGFGLCRYRVREEYRI